MKASGHAGVHHIGESFELAIDSLRRNPLRSLLTILGIVIGVSTIIAISAVVNGLNSNVVASIESLGSNIVIAARLSWTNTGRPTQEMLQRKYLEPEWTEDIAQLPHVVAAAASLRYFQPEFDTGTSFVRRGDTREKRNSGRRFAFGGADF